ncbi:MAG: hypothetical protein K8I00_05445 [Candidatus Omnitrophica bacterium]|nr:hypothetical protein [Candidatus Omnitrophota bacterium]
MKIIIEHEGHRVTLEDDAVVDVCDAIDLMEQALMGVGYAPERLQGAFLIKAKQIEEA